MILGTVSAGPGGVVLPGPATRIDAIEERESEAVLPEVVLPGDLAFGGPGILEISGRSEWKGAAQRVDGLVVRPGGSLHLVGPLVLQTGSLVLEPGARLVVDDSGGPVTLYCTGSLDAQAGSLVSMAQESRQLHGFTLLVPRPADLEDDERVTLDALGDLRGVIYAPGDRLTIRAGLKIYGSVVARHVTLDDDAWVTVDQALEVGGDGLPALSKSRRWQVVTPSDEDVAVAARSQAKPPAELVAEKVIEVIYMDENDVRATYSGHVDRFDASSPSASSPSAGRTRTRASSPTGSSPRGRTPRRSSPAGARNSARSPRSIGPRRSARSAARARSA